VLQEIKVLTPEISHDEIANILGVPSKSFEEIYQDKAREMKRTLLEYVKTLQGVIDNAGSIPAGAGLSTITLDPEGFPVAPNPPSWDKYTKDDLERLYRLYLTHHYRECLLPMAFLN
jgi:hypothetical protein